MRVDNLREALQVLNLARLDELTGPGGVPLDDVVLEFPQLREVDLRLAEVHTPRLRTTRLVDERRDVQQRLRGDAAAIHADAAGTRFGVHECDAETEVGAEKRGRVPTRPTTHDHELDRSHTPYMQPRRHEDTKPRHSTQNTRKPQRIVFSAGSAVSALIVVLSSCGVVINGVIPAAPAGTAARGPGRPTAGSGRRRRRRSRGDRRTATRGASAAGQTHHSPGPAPARWPARPALSARV